MNDEDLYRMGLAYAADTGSSEYALLDVVEWLKETGWEIVTFWTREDYDLNEEVADAHSLCPEDGLFVKGRL